MASTARPRPRPVPRAKAAPAEASSSKASSNGASKAPPSVVDDDTMFMRNQGRSSLAWKKLDKLNDASKTKAKAKARSDSEGDSDSPRPRKQSKSKTAGDPHAKIARLLSQELSDESDSDELEITDTFDTPAKTKRKRRSRSRSITPPPALPRYQLQQAREVVRQALGHAQSRSPSPVPYEADESTDTIIFDPELEKLARAAQANRSFSEPAAESQSTDTVEITVKWQPHPSNESGKEWKVVFKLNRTDNFRELFEATAEDASILVENLVMSYNGARLFPSVTPATLKIWDEGELVACDRVTWDYLRANPTAAIAATPVVDVDDSDTDAPSPVYSNTQESDAESDAGGETFKLVLRSALTTKDITVTVRPTTTCGAIVQAFLKKAGLAEKYGKGPRQSIGGKKGKGKGKRGAPPEPEKDPQLSIDGDKMAHDIPIGDMDLDDGDMVDVVGL
ncbi:hypothetical protein B0H15DRAFT_496947 [Mycena belliarum]|uniref:Rad60/SUMO-like domain-containing protein n=1 Tax=Mycena belliarum TaxID=1033014 RepID=A0AAD6TWD0_9AGAR|nr:hypothetical protein B0H15DRAFT_496947 [Mycena belliae]